MSVRRVVVWVGLVALAAVGGAAVARRRVPEGLVDWGLAGRTARKLAGEPVGWRASEELTGRYDSIVRESFGAVSEYTGEAMEVRSDEVRVLGRADWIEANLVNFERLLAPLAVAYGQTRAGSGALGRVAAHGTRYTVTAQIGLLLGYLGRRVLGQYDIPILDAEAEWAGIYFVEPNIARVAAKAGVDLEALRMWVALHEATHAYQFRVGDPPWLRGYTAGLIQDYLAEAIRALESGEGLGERLRDMWRRFDTDDPSGSGLMRLALTDGQAESLGRIQALMTVMEGYSNHVMRATGRTVIPEYEVLERRMKAREEARGASSRVLNRLLGLDLKLEQYRVGEAFVEKVVGLRGLEFMNGVWKGAALLPSLEETRDAEGWIERIEGRGERGEK